VEGLHVAADPLDVDVQREERLEARRQYQERQQRAQGDGDDRDRRDRDACPPDEDDRDEHHPEGASLADRRPQRGEFQPLVRRFQLVCLTAE